ncbi:hypothetical protein N657DRAFT_648940 [Parathielavia appendiculata]|uniref:Uncharacterized protein n=1 Tax=Parathielavia appendiculata TaxID=2587402 RepID=A0AAN6Z1E6_9PEZI|nr:hypothetical protein N657DRAFT_648940 [Parathielavia appendiculata]
MAGRNSYHRESSSTPGWNSTTPGAKRCLFGRSAHVEGLFGGIQWVREAELYMGAANGKREP